MTRPQQACNMLKQFRKNPNIIFEVKKMFETFTKEEHEEYLRIGNSDEFSMYYLTALNMKNQGTWDAFVEKRKKASSKFGTN